jgi:ankyrin repeat protein
LILVVIIRSIFSFFIVHKEYALFMFSYHPFMCSYPDAKSQLGQTALQSAAEKGHTDCVRLLLEAGADKETKDIVRVRPFWTDTNARLVAPF